MRFGARAGFGSKDHEIKTASARTSGARAGSGKSTSFFEISELPVATHEYPREFWGSLYSIEPECQSLFFDFGVRHHEPRSRLFTRLRARKKRIGGNQTPILGQEGWTRHQEKYREASFDGADGVVVQDQTEMFLNLNNHPVCAVSDADALFLTGAATPPGQEGRWPSLTSVSPPAVSAVDRSRAADFKRDDGDIVLGAFALRPRLYPLPKGFEALCEWSCAERVKLGTQSVHPEHLAVGVHCLRQPVRIEPEALARPERGHGVFKLGLLEHADRELLARRACGLAHSPR